MDNGKVISILNDLIETCRDGQEGFKEASENATSPPTLNASFWRPAESGLAVSENSNKKCGRWEGIRKKVDLRQVLSIGYGWTSKAP
jgi:hypothetical protein